MTGSSRHYLIRMLISIIWGGLFALLGWPWWSAVIMGGIAFAWFLWAPRSGRYVVRSESGGFGLRRDERTQRINDKAARNAWMVTMLATAGVGIYFGYIAPANVPVAILSFVLLLGMLVYWVSDIRLRRL
jgi:hypothetical protein